MNFEQTVTSLVHHLGVLCWRGVWDHLLDGRLGLVAYTLVADQMSL
jgi:hypothetical protein